MYLLDRERVQGRASGKRSARFAVDTFISSFIFIFIFIFSFHLSIFLFPPFLYPFRIYLVYLFFFLSLITLAFCYILYCRNWDWGLNWDWDLGWSMAGTWKGVFFRWHFMVMSCG